MLYARARSQPMRNTQTHNPGVRNWRRGVALLTMLPALLFVSHSPCFAQKPVVLRRIEFVGLKKLTSQQVIDASGLKVGSTINPQVLDAAADKLMQSGM